MASRLSVERACQISPARKQNAKFFRTINISIVEGATYCGAVFGADAGAGGRHSASPRGQGCDRHGPDRNRQDISVFDSGDGKTGSTKGGRKDRKSVV